MAAATSGLLLVAVHDVDRNRQLGQEEIEVGLAPDRAVGDVAEAHSVRPSRWPTT